MSIKLPIDSYLKRLGVRETGATQVFDALGLPRLQRNSRDENAARHRLKIAQAFEHMRINPLWQTYELDDIASFIGYRLVYLYQISKPIARHIPVPEKV